MRRFAKTYRDLTRPIEVRGVPVETMTEALACMVEQCCYVWFAQDEEFQRVDLGGRGRPSHQRRRGTQRCSRDLPSIRTRLGRRPTATASPERSRGS